MKFYSCNLERPVRLSEQTRLFAHESLNHKYGLEARSCPSVPIDDAVDFDALAPYDRYDRAIASIASNAPIRICSGELISGAATLGDAIDHCIPVSHRGRNHILSSVSHLTVDFPYVLKYGVNHLRKEIDASLEAHQGTSREAFLRSCHHCLDAFELWHKRYLDTLSDLPEYEQNYKNLLRVPFEPPTTFHEAVQSIWFTFAFLRLCGNWPGIGRLDAMLEPFLQADLKAGRLTLDEAREILAHFFIKGCEWITGIECVSGDAQHYQNIILAGIDENGRDVTGDATYLILDVLEELGISDFPTTIRVNSHTDEKLLCRVAQVMRYGGGILAVYNEDLILDCLTRYGYELKEARQFANDGCWEVQIPGKTDFAYIPFDALQILQNKTLGGYADDISFPDFESLYQQFAKDLHTVVGEVLHNAMTSDPPAYVCPATVVALFERGCIEKGLDYFSGGPVYNVVSPHIGGLPDVVNSLYAIRKLVYDEKKVTLQELMRLLRNNWEGAEPLRQYALRHYRYYGNDNDEVDTIAARIINDFSASCDIYDKQSFYRHPAGVSTFGRQLNWAPDRKATAHGHKAGDVLAGNMSPTPGTDFDGATAIIRSYCKADLTKTVTGAALDIRLLPSSVNGEAGLNALVSLIRSFVALGGFFMQPDVVDASVLKEAQLHPEQYQTLSVRVSGWNARFVTLNKDWQNMVIQQAEK